MPQLLLNLLNLPQNLCRPLKTFPVFLLGTENFMGRWVGMVVVVCGKICGCGKIETFLDWNKEDCITAKDPCPPPTVFSVPERRKKVGGVKKEEKEKEENKTSIC